MNADTDREALMASLRSWGKRQQALNAERDPLVWRALAAGISIEEIHKATDLARTTINRIEDTMPKQADEFYLEARDAVMAAVRELDPKHKRFRTPDGIVFYIQRKMPLRILLLGVNRTTPGEDGYTAFTFQRDGRVGLGGNRKVPLRDAMSRGHEPWASRDELEELAAQIKTAEPSG